MILIDQLLFYCSKRLPVSKECNQSVRQRCQYCHSNQISMRTYSRVESRVKVYSRVESRVRVKGETFSENFVLHFFKWLQLPARFSLWLPSAHYCQVASGNWQNTQYREDVCWIAPFPLPIHQSRKSYPPLKFRSTMLPLPGIDEVKPCSHYISIIIEF